MEWLKITTNSEIIRIPTDEIIFIKGDGNYSDIFLANGKKENVISQLHDLMDKLTALNYSPFYRVGKSLIINRDYIFNILIPISGDGLPSASSHPWCSALLHTPVGDSIITIII